MFQNTNVVFLNTFNAILNIMDANACVPSVEFIYGVAGGSDSSQYTAGLRAHMHTLSQY